MRYGRLHRPPTHKLFDCFLCPWLHDREIAIKPLLGHEADVEPSRAPDPLLLSCCVTKHDASLHTRPWPSGKPVFRSQRSLSHPCAGNFRVEMCHRERCCLECLRRTTVRARLAHGGPPDLRSIGKVCTLPSQRRQSYPSFLGKLGVGVRLCSVGISYLGGSGLGPLREPCTQAAQLTVPILSKDSIHPLPPRPP